MAGSLDHEELLLPKKERPFFQESLNGSAGGRAPMARTRLPAPLSSCRRIPCAYRAEHAVLEELGRLQVVGVGMGEKDKFDADPIYAVAGHGRGQAAEQVGVARIDEGGQLTAYIYRCLRCSPGKTARDRN